MAACFAEPPPRQSLEPVLTDQAGSETSPSPESHVKDVLHLSLPRIGESTYQQGRRLRLRATSASTPPWSKRKPSPAVSLQELQDSTNYGSPSARSCLSRRERQQQVLRALMPDEVERRCAEDLVAAAATAVPGSAVSLFPHALSSPSPATRDIWRQPLWGFEANEESPATTLQNETRFNLPAEPKSRLACDAEQLEAQSALWVQGAAVIGYVGYQQRLPAAGGLQSAEIRQLPATPLAQLYLHQWRVMGPYDRSMPRSRSALPVSYHLHASQQIQGYHQHPSRFQQRRLSQQQFHHRFQQQVSQLDRGCIVPAVVLQHAASATPSKGVMRPSAQPLRWGRFTCSWV